MFLLGTKRLVLKLMQFWYFKNFQSKGKLSTAIDDGWIDERTRAVVVDLVLYCNPSRIFTSVQLVAEIPPIGNIYTGNSEVRSFPEIEYQTIGHYALLGVRPGSTVQVRTVDRPWLVEKSRDPIFKNILWCGSGLFDP